MAVRKLEFFRKKLAPTELPKRTQFKIRTYRPNINIEFETGRFIVKTIENGIDLEKLLRLRYRVFLNELNHSDIINGIDYDKYDLKFDHLAVIDKESGDFVGTYRLNSSQFNSSFYSESEFHMDKILSLKGSKLELGRACIEPAFRDGATMGALLKGIGRYIEATDSRYVIGCSSVYRTDSFRVALIHSFVEKNYYSPKELRVKPKQKYKVKRFGKLVKIADEPRFDHFRNAAAKSIPALLNMYLKAGGYICGKPALDKSFNCVDYFTLLDMEKINKSFKKRFFSI